MVLGLKEIYNNVFNNIFDLKKPWREKQEK